MTSSVATVFKRHREVEEMETRDKIQKTSSVFIDRVTFGNVHEVKEMIDAGEDVNASDAYGVTALMKACERGHEEIVKVLLKAGAKVDACDEDGWTSLMAASRYGREKILELLLRYRKNDIVNASDTRGTTALIEACHCKHQKVMEMLLKAGADVTASRKDGTAAMSQYVRHNSMLKTYLFFQYIGTGNVEKVKEMIAAGADVNAVDDVKDSCYRTPLIWALEKDMARRENMVKTLLDAGADVNTPHFCGLTPLMMATKNCRLTIMLLNAGADLDTPGEGLDNKTALMFACEDGSECVVALLLAHGANPNLGDLRGNTALDFGEHNSMITNMLLKAGAKK